MRYYWNIYRDVQSMVHSFDISKGTFSNHFSLKGPQAVSGKPFRESNTFAPRSLKTRASGLLYKDGWRNVPSAQKKVETLQVPNVLCM